MKLIERLKNLGDGMCELECEVCHRPVYFDVNNKRNNGMVICRGCGDEQRLKDVVGLYFMEMKYEGGSGGKNWKCGACDCEFIFHDGETEASIECPNCHAKREADNELSDKK
jgi:DNA-directed RNA polymerase subunit RPC12/RpoP